MYLLTHYRSSLDFSLENLGAAKTSYESLKNKIVLINQEQSEGKDSKKYLEDFQKAIDDDLNMPRAIQVLQKLLKDDKVSGEAKIEAIKKMDEVFGLDLLKKEKISVPEEVRALAEQREKARKMKDFKKADEVRDKIKELGFVVNDTSEGWEIRVA
jgi:cysteinyl-tRNA synthetase